MIEYTAAKFFDDEGVDTIAYMVRYIMLWSVLFLAMMYLISHITWFKGEVLTPVFPSYDKETIKEGS